MPRTKKVSLKKAKSRKFNQKKDEIESQNFMDTISQQIDHQNEVLANVPLQFYGRGFSLLDTSIVPTAVPTQILSPKPIEAYAQDLDFKSRNERPMRPFTAKTKSKMAN